MLNEDKDREVAIDEWRALSFEKKRDILHDWSPYIEDRGNKLRNEILMEFKTKIKDKKDIKKIEFGWQGFDVLYIFVTIKKGKKVRLPRVYDEVFPVKKVYE